MVQSLSPDDSFPEIMNQIAKVDAGAPLPIIKKPAAPLPVVKKPAALKAGLKLTKDAEKVPSIQSYHQFCEKMALEFGLDPSTSREASYIDLTDPVKIVSTNVSENFFCYANVNYKNHEITLSAVAPVLDKSHASSFWMKDACSLSQKLFNNTEACQDGMRDPRLRGLGRLSTIETFLSACNQKLEASRNETQSDLRRAALERIFVKNTTLGDGKYSLNFFSQGGSCVGSIDTNRHSMRIEGSLKDIYLVDDCMLTRKALGKNELDGKCEDGTFWEREKSEVVNVVLNTGAILWGGMELLGQLRFGHIKLGSPTGHLFRAASVLRAAGMVGRVPSFLGGAGTVATASAGATVAAATAGFAIGFGVGYLFENVPRWLGAKKSVSDGIAWGLEKAFGPADLNSKFFKVCEFIGL